MKKGWKTALIISGIVGGIGIGCCIAAVVLGVSWKEFRPYFFPHVSWLHKEEVSSPSSEDKMKTLGTYKGIGKLSIQVSSMKTYFQIDENLRGEIRIQGENLDDRTGVDIRQDKEELSVESSSHKIFGGFVDNTNSALWIYLPQDFRLEETSIDVGAGSVYAEQILSKKMEIDVGAGAVEMDQFKAEELDIDCGAGGVTMLGGNAPEKVLIDCGANGENNPKECITLNSPYKTFNGQINRIIALFDDGQFVIEDGSIILIEDMQGSKYKFISVDVNGRNKNPNRWGYDLFTFELMDNGQILPMGAPETRYTDKNEYCSQTSTNVYNGIACTYYAINEKNYFTNLSN